ncbi:hypothetical protein [Nocardia sp. X0981]
MPLDVTFVSGNTTSGKLSRVTALMTWRLPAIWIFLAILPVLLLGRGIAKSFSRSAGEEVDSGEFFGAFFVVVAFELVVCVLLTGWGMLRGNANVRRYTRPGTLMAARYGHDAVHLRLPQTA